MGAQLRIYRRRMRSVKATKKITKAMELISASRIVKAQQRVAASSPYANELTRAVTAVASFSSTNHPLTTPSENPRRAAVLIITADRGMAGAYSNAAIKEGDQLVMALRERGLATEAYLVGRKAVNYYRFRSRKIAGSWTGFSDNPTFVHAKEVSDALISAFLADAETVETGVDELHIVYTQFKSMITQIPEARRMLPLEVVESEATSSTLLPMYEFEPNAAEVLNSLLPRYIEARVFNAMLQSAASEHAARRRAMKSATDNADELIKSLTRLANAARQAEITQEISEIVGGADALASASAGSE
ncbi:MAG: F0F1 ATP synthase subunit gamma [Actinobacteria bacterium]|jgi:F-type H+-transporting ATPase subunit gamma|nr:F0F1 ATP synthase subunit gamma [Actinomycetota bacterium]MDA2981367.1 F0F1 ATP synthase subunit gamma [Actinomycetota bacterium]MDA2996491.1 F0F1 ATP synthase subunit gamma [Actinomycetota bacterium]